MLVFWLMFCIPMLAALGSIHSSRQRSLFPWVLIGGVFSILIGLRYQVGGDWVQYMRHYQAAIDNSFLEALTITDPGYAALNWLSSLVSGDVYLVNLAAGLVLMTGVIAFARRQPSPWLAFSVAVPYLIVVVGMGYTRQSMALGMAMLGLVALAERQGRRFVVYVLIGALFHKSAVLLLPVAALASTRNRIWSYFWVGVISLVAAYLLIAQEQENLWYQYVDLQMVSEGGMIRVAMNAVPAVLFLLFRRKIAPDSLERRLWTIMAVLCLVTVPLVALASTAVDRVSLYLIPMQLFLFSRLHSITREKTAIVVATLIGYALVMFVWLNFAVHARYWLPYKFAPLYW